MKRPNYTRLRTFGKAAAHRRKYSAPIAGFLEMHRSLPAWEAEPVDPCPSDVPVKTGGSFETEQPYPPRIRRIAAYVAPDPAWTPLRRTSGAHGSIELDPASTPPRTLPGLAALQTSARGALRAIDLSYRPVIVAATGAMNRLFEGNLASKGAV